MNFLKTEHQKQIVKVQLYRPNVRNAFNPEMIAELTRLFKELGKNRQVRVVILSGAGASFCAGADLDWMKSMAKYTKAQNKKDAEKLFEMFESLYRLPAVLIGQAHGHVMGGGLGLLAVCDLVVAAEKTEFCFSEAKLGLSPAVISAFVKNKISPSEMSRWFLTAAPFSSQKAQEMGLVQEVVAEAEMESVVQKWSQQILQNGPQAVIATKKLLQQIHGESSLIKLKKTTSTLISQLRVGQEGQEGLQSFLEKRSPNWRTP